MAVKRPGILDRIRLGVRWLRVCWAGTSVGEALGGLGVPENVKEAYAAMKSERPEGKVGGSLNFDDWASLYQPDKIVEDFKYPVLNPVLAFQEAIEANGDDSKLSEGNPFKGMKINVREAFLYEAHVDENGRMVRDPKILESMRDKWPLPYRVRRVRGHQAYAESIKKAKAVHEAQPARAEKARETARRREAMVKALKEDGFLGSDFNGNTGNYDINQYTEFVPLVGGPFYRQLYIYDFLKMCAYAFEAQNHNPIAKAILRILTQYAFGRRFEMRIDDDRQRKVWEAHDQKYKIVRNICEFWAREAEMYGDFMLDTDRWESVDPSTIWDIITDPEHVNDAYYYYQSYPTAYQMFTGFSVPGQPGAAKQKASDYIVRQIPANKILHMKLNCVSNEKRGRSTLFPILGWLKRIKDLYNAQVIREWLYSSFIWDVTVKGSAAEVTAYAGQFPNMPPPGSPYIHNEAVTLAPMAALPSTGSKGGSSMGEELICFIAVSCQIPKEFLNVISTGGGSRAQALTAAEPFTKMIEDIQARWEGFITEIFKTVMIQNGLDYKEGDVEVLFPSVTKDTTTEMGKNLSLAETMGWLSKRTAAEMFAKELNITSYDFEDEQGKIKEDEQAGFDKTGQPQPPAGRFGNDPKADDGESEIHGNGKNKLAGNLKTL